jgi:hypothetical protein
MNEPPPPYSVKHLLSGEFGVFDSRTGRVVAWRRKEEEALQVCHHRNAGYSEGWRDRDEQGADDE